MKLIVDIPEYRYRAIKKIDTTKKPYTIDERSAITVIKNSIPLEQAIQEMMKYEHDGFINISLARLDEILKKCGVKE